MSAAKSPATPSDTPASYTPPELPPGIVKAFGVFKAHFAELLAKHPKRIAACDGERVLFIGDDQQELYTKCLKRGLKEGEFIVVWIVPDATDYMN
jgi:hypothetical protein